MKRMVDKTRAELRLEAYAKLEITDLDELRRLNPISAQLGMIMSKLRARGLPASPYFYLKCAPGEDARNIVDLYYNLSMRLRQSVPIEAYCYAAGVDPAKILALIATTVATVAQQTSQILSAATHLNVVEKTIDMALTDDGIADRATLHKATGFLPTPAAARGSQTTVSVIANSSAAADATSTAQTVTVLAPPPEQTIRRLVDRFNDARAQKTLAAESARQLPPASQDTGSSVNHRVYEPEPEPEPELIDSRAGDDAGDSD